MGYDGVFGFWFGDGSFVMMGRQTIGVGIRHRLKLL
jgi:hypothetical protein